MRIYHPKARIDTYPAHSYVDLYRGMKTGFALISGHTRPEIIAISASRVGLEWLTHEGSAHIAKRFWSVGGEIVTAAEFNRIANASR
jgi:hypothetical protein